MPDDTSKARVNVHHYEIYSQVQISNPEWDSDLMIESQTESGAERRADLARELFRRYGDDLFIVNKAYSKVIPVKVAVDGKASMASYMYVFFEKSKDSIADELSISSNTVDQYLSDVLSHRR